MAIMSESPRCLPELAYYYGPAAWIGSSRLLGWTKSLLLFFDGIATSYAPGEFDRLVAMEPVVAQPLVERNLLVNYAPRGPLGDVIVNSSVAPRITNEFVKDAGRRVVFFGPLADGFLKETETEPQPTISAAHMDLETFRRSKAPSVRQEEMFEAVVTAARADALRREIDNAAIQPITNNEIIAELVAGYLMTYARASKGRVIASDLKVIGLDFTDLPLDDVLDFRAQYGSEFRSYARDLRRFTLQLSLVDAKDEAFVIRDRAEEWEERANELRQLSRKAMKKSVIALAFGVAGAAWTLSQGDPWGAIFAGGGAAAAFGFNDPTPVGSNYSYVLRARNTLRR
jgi:hypothetical protein